MKTIVQTCTRCGTVIPYFNVDKGNQHYKCASCDAVGSIIVDGEVEVHDFKQELPSDSIVYAEGDSLILKSTSSKYLPQKVGLLGCGSLTLGAVICVVIFIAQTSSFNYDDGSYFASVCIIMLPILYFSIRYMNSQYNKPVFFEISPYSFSVYKEKKSVIYTCPSYMIDKIIVTELPMQENQNGTVNRCTMQVLQKDTKLQIVLIMSATNKDVLDYVKEMVEQFINR